MALLEIIIIVHLVLNTYVTYRVIRSESFENKQKFFQSMIIWLLPIFGLILIWIFIDNDESPKPPRNPNDGQGNDSLIGGAQ